MFVKTYPSIVVEVMLEEHDRFVAKDRFANRDAHGQYGKAEIHKLRLTKSALYGEREQLWAEGLRMRTDGSVGSRRASQVLLSPEQVPEAVRAEIKRAYLTAVRDLWADASTGLA